MVQGSEKEVEASRDLFKQITEAYAILSDDVLRKKYDKLLFGSDSQSFSEDQAAYEYWSKKDGSKRVMEEYEEM